MLGIIQSDEKGVKVYINEKEWSGTTIKNYSIGINGKDTQGNWNRAFLCVKFKKGQEPINKSTILIKSSFMSTKKWGKSYIPQLIITDYELLEAGKGFAPADDFMQIPSGVCDELPFS